jgi:hypothetical protein
VNRSKPLVAIRFPDDARNESGYKMLLLVRVDGVDEQVLVLPHTFEQSLKLRKGRHAVQGAPFVCADSCLLARKV